MLIIIIENSENWPQSFLLISLLIGNDTRQIGKFVTPAFKFNCLLPPIHEKWEYSFLLLFFIESAIDSDIRAVGKFRFNALV